MKTPIDKIWMDKFDKEFTEMLNFIEAQTGISERPKIKQFFSEYGKAMKAEGRAEAIEEQEEKIKGLMDELHATWTSPCDGFRQIVIKGLTQLLNK